MEWRDKNLVFRLNGKEVGRNIGIAKKLHEPMFTIFIYVKISRDRMEGEWEMEIVWVKHEIWVD